MKYLKFGEFSPFKPLQAIRVIAVGQNWVDEVPVSLSPCQPTVINQAQSIRF